MAANTDAGAVEDRRGLQELAFDLAGIAERASALADREGLEGDGEALSSSQVRALLYARHRRSAALRLDIVQPGWSVLLVLFCAHLEGRPVRMARLATEAHVALTTLMRWMEVLVARGLAERRPDPVHKRGVLFALSAKGAERVGRQLEKEAAAWMRE
jgi:DNA-binding MarR family transcriptional regulator